MSTTHDRGPGPDDGVEAALTRIWRQVLATDDLTSASNFFELGGESIAGMRIVAIAKKDGIAISLRDIFEHQTIHDICESLLERER